MQTWYQGLDDYQKITFHVDLQTQQHVFHLELLDRDTDENQDLNTVWNLHLAQRNGQTVEILYSGGIDSEIVLIHCLKNAIPVRAITMRLLINGYAINTHDLYYSEQFCRQHGVEQVIIDLSADKFFENGDHVAYLEPYLITTPHVATHFWLFEQCSAYPVIGGDYSWPWHDRRILSPQRHAFACYQQFLQDRSIDGIGGMINHSLASNFKFIQTHLGLFDRRIHSGLPFKIPTLKQDITKALGFGDLQRRMRSYGWEGLSKSIFDLNQYEIELVRRFGTTSSSISWNQKIGAALGSGSGYNNRYS